MNKVSNVSLLIFFVCFYSSALASDGSHTENKENSRFKGKAKTSYYTDVCNREDVTDAILRSINQKDCTRVLKDDLKKIKKISLFRNAPEGDKSHKKLPENSFYGLENLEEINFEGFGNSLLADVDLTMNEKIKDISISFNSFHDYIDINFLKGAKNIEVLSISTVFGFSLSGKNQIKVLYQPTINYQLATKEDKSFFEKVRVWALELIEREKKMDSIEVPDFVNLKQLWLEGVIIPRISSSFFKEAKKLEVLSLVGNGLNDYTVDSLSGFKNLKIVRISKNRLISPTRTLFKNLINLEELDLSGNLIANLSWLDLEKCERLTKVNLSENKINFLNRHTFKSCSELQDIDLSKNQIKTLPESILLNNSFIRKVDISQNRLKSFSMRFFKENSQLNSLDLSYNKIEVLEQKAFEKLWNLKKLNLSYNKLSELSPQLFSNTGLFLNNLDVKTNHNRRSLSNHLTINNNETLDYYPVDQVGIPLGVLGKLEIEKMSQKNYIFLGKESAKQFEFKENIIEEIGQYFEESEGEVEPPPKYQNTLKFDGLQEGYFLAISDKLNITEIEAWQSAGSVSQDKQKEILRELKENGQISSHQFANIRSVSKLDPRGEWMSLTFNQKGTRGVRYLYYQGNLINFDVPYHSGDSYPEQKFVGRFKSDGTTYLVYHHSSCYNGLEAIVFKLKGNNLVHVKPKFDPEWAIYCC